MEERANEFAPRRGHPLDKPYLAGAAHHPVKVLEELLVGPSRIPVDKRELSEPASLVFAREHLILAFM